MNKYFIFYFGVIFSLMGQDDLLGREVITLVDGTQEAGYRSVSWHGMNHSGNGVGAGMYFYVIQAGDFRKIKKMILLK